jgi:hypothetical protein
MSWINGLLIGAGEGIRRGGARYFEERDKRARQELAAQQHEEERTESMDRMLRSRDEFEERKRANRASEALNQQELVQRGMERLVTRENSRYAVDEATRRAVETALINAQSRQAVAGMPARSRPAAAAPPAKKPTQNPDGLTQTQRDGLMLINKDWLPGERQEMREMERLFRQARKAFPNAHPGDVAAAAKRMYDREKRAKQDRY